LSIPLFCMPSVLGDFGVMWVDRRMPIF
jgi:hypothetical protein